MEDQLKDLQNQNDQNGQGGKDSSSQPIAPDPKDQRIKELEENWKRAIADYKNLERRITEEKASIMAFSNLILLERLIPVLDNLESLGLHIKDQGLDIITKQLADILKDEGVEEIKALGAVFDPSIMEASEVVDGDDGKVLEVVAKGYKLQDKVIRPARVKVGKKKLE